MKPRVANFQIQATAGDLRQSSSTVARRPPRLIRGVRRLVESILIGGHP
jgi:hypothetical protein